MTGLSSRSNTAGVYAVPVDNLPPRFPMAYGSERGRWKAMPGTARNLKGAGRAIGTTG